MAKFNNQFATQKLRQEMSVTGTGATFTPGTGEQTAPRATKKVVKKKLTPEEKDVEPKLAAGKAKVYMKNKWGWKDAPSVPNRPSKGGFIYKQLFEELSNSIKTNSQELARVEGLLAKARETKNYSVISAYENRIKQLKLIQDLEKKLGKQLPVLTYGQDFSEYIKSNLNQTINEAVNRVHIGTDTKTDSNIYFEPSTGTFSINVIDGLGNRWNKLQVNTIDDVIAKFPSWSWTEKGIELFPEFEPEEQDDDEDKFNWYTGDYELNESYSKFKTETKTRGKSDQFHQAVREVRRKVQEINRLFEYVSRLKTELSEGEGGLKYKMHTEKALAKIKEMVSELNQNIKKFK
jgi:hypothetical protein